MGRCAESHLERGVRPWVKPWNAEHAAGRITRPLRYNGNSDSCTDPNCYAAKLDAHVKAKVAAKPELVQISTAYKQQPEGEKTIPRNKYVEIREEKPDTPEKAKWPEFKTCKYTTEAIVSDGIEKGELRKVCTEPTCPVHHPKKQMPKADASFKAEQEKRRCEEALANATGIRVLQSIVAAVPVRLMKRELLFVAEQLLPLLDEKRLEMVARNRSIKAKDGESVGKLLTAFTRKADEGTIGKLIVEAVILLSARSQADGGKVHDLVRDSSVDVLLFNSLHNFSPLRAGEQPHPLVAELFCRGCPSRHRAAVLWLARALPLTAGRGSSASGCRGGDEVRTRRGKGDEREAWTSLKKRRSWATGATTVTSCFRSPTR
jgi:hypothetical protein